MSCLPLAETAIDGILPRMAVSISVDLVERSGDLKRDLVQFAQGPRFSGALRKATRERFRSRVITDEGQLYDFLDWFVLQHRLADGRRVVEHFVAAQRALSEVERQMLLGWRDVVEGLFEIGLRDGPALLAVNLIDEMTYRMRANAGPSVFDAMRRGDFMVARLVPIGDEWLLSGAQHLFPRSGRKEVLQTVAQLSLKRPDLVFRNLEKLEQGWELQKWERGRFVEFFGADLVVFRGSELADRFDAYWQWRARQTVNGEERRRGSQSHNVPTFELPDRLLQAETVAVIYDELEGLTFLGEFGLVEAVFDDPGLLADRDHRRAVLGYLSDDTVSPLPFRRLAQRNTETASRVFQRLLKKPTFSWERDGEHLLRRRKPGFFDRPALPRVTPASAALIEAAGSR
jgi:hypothetical protein